MESNGAVQANETHPTVEVKDSCIGAVLVSEQEIASRISELGTELSNAYSGLQPILVAVLKGSYVFAADLSRAIQASHEIEFIRARSYSGTASTGSVTISGLSEVDMRDRHVLIVEDIVDTGLTLKEISKEIRGRGAKSVKTVTFVQKRTDRRVSDVPPVDYFAFELPDQFIVGYGLDVDQRLRHLPYVAVYNPHKSK